MKTLKIQILILVILRSIAINAQTNAFKVEVTGKGNPILLFPGFTCPGEVWEDTVNELSKTNECHVFTFAGFSDVPAIEKPWLPKIKEGIETYIQKNKLKNITLIGHSLGGALSLWLGSDDIVEVNKIIIVDALASTGALMIPNFNSDMIAYDTPYNNQILKMSDQDFAAMASQMVSGMVINEEKRKLLKDWIVNTDRATYVYGYTDLLKLDLREDISKITAEVSIIAATQPYGIEVVKKTYKDQFKNLENYTIQYADNAAHFIMYDQPNWFIQTVKKEL